MLRRGQQRIKVELLLFQALSHKPYQYLYLSPLKKKNPSKQQQQQQQQQQKTPNFIIPIL